ncbi:MAG: hypothetical protein ABEJ68_11325 [Halobacteriaceae archaeon]
MHDVALVLEKQGRGPVTVETEDGTTYELELTETEHDESGFHAEAEDQFAEDVFYRLSAPKHDGERVQLERRHARDEEWTDLGPVVAATKES